jgi:anti-sigma28 factor (negative regulator of flagellin synthesis)
MNKSKSPNPTRGKKAKKRQRDSVVSPVTKTAVESKALQKVNATAVEKTANEVELTKELRQAIAQMYGVQDNKLATVLINQAMQVRDAWSSSTVGDGMETALTMLMEMQPKTLTEALLAVQMLGVHAATMTSLQRAAFASVSSDVPDVHMTRARTLMRLFLEQVEVIQKLKGKTGQQTVVVKHVDVHGGGQAIVGAVTSAGRTGGGGAKQERGSRETQKKTSRTAPRMAKEWESAG